MHIGQWNNTRKTRKRPTILAAALAAWGLMTAAAHAFDDNDQQLWVELSADKSLGQAWHVLVRYEARYGDGISDFYLFNTEAGVMREMGPFLDLSFIYRQQYDEVDTTWREERRPCGVATLKWHILGIAFKDRNRLEMRWFEEANESWRYRNQLTITPPLTLTKWFIQPYVADEVFYDFEPGKLDRNRLTAGLRASVGFLTPTIYAMWQADCEAQDWQNTFVYGVGMGLWL